MPTYRAKMTHVRTEGFFKRVVRAYTDDVTTESIYDPSVPPYYFVAGGGSPLPAPSISFESPKVTIECKGAEKIFYTTDGSAPDESKTLYTGEITLSASATVRAVGVYGTVKSPVSEKTCDISTGGQETGDTDA